MEQEIKEYTLEQHKKFISSWIGSCERKEQLDILMGVIEEFVVKRFKKMKLPDKEIGVAAGELIVELNERKKLISAGFVPITNTQE